MQFNKMTSKQAFENNYEDMMDDITKLNLLSISADGISKSFQHKLVKYQNAKLNLLKTNINKTFTDGTVYTGSGGLALYYFNCGVSEKNDLDLMKALQYLDLNALKGHRISFLCGDAGPLAIATVIAHKLGDQRPDCLPDYQYLAHRLLSLINLLHTSPDEVLYGKAGYLYALLFVNNFLPGTSTIPTNHMKKVTVSILQSGKQLSAEMKFGCPLVWQWHEKIYYGAAHGMAGILYILLQARSYIENSEINDYIKPTIDWLLKQSFPSSNFPSSMGSSSGDRLVQWCHGAPGFIPLCITAAEVFKDNKYLDIACKSAEVVWRRGLCTKGYSICHGVAGNAYTFIQLYQATKEPQYFYRACCFLDWCVLERQGTQCHTPDRPASLFEGMIGGIYLAHDIKHILNAKFPAFEL